MQSSDKAEPSWFQESLLLTLCTPESFSVPSANCVCVCVCVCSATKCGQLFCDSMDCSLPGSSVHGYSPGKDTGVGCHSLLQGIFPTQG